MKMLFQEITFSVMHSSEEEIHGIDHRRGTCIAPTKEDLQTQEQWTNIKWNKNIKFVLYL